MPGFRTSLLKIFMATLNVAKLKTIDQSGAFEGLAPLNYSTQI